MSTGQSTVEVMTGLWCEVFECAADEVDPDEEFFEAGGTSYQALTLTTRVAETFGVEIPLLTVLTEGSVSILAEAVDEQRNEALLAELEGLSDEQARRLLAAESAEGV